MLTFIASDVVLVDRDKPEHCLEIPALIFIGLSRANVKELVLRKAVSFGLLFDPPRQTPTKVSLGIRNGDNGAKIYNPEIKHAFFVTIDELAEAANHPLPLENWDYYSTLLYVDETDRSLVAFAKSLFKFQIPTLDLRTNKSAGLDGTFLN